MVYLKILFVSYLQFVLIISIAQPFSLDEELTGLLPYVSDGVVTWGDYDGDGDMDILISGSQESTNILHLYRNDFGIFDLVDFEFAGLGYSNISWNDFDNDNDLDIFYTGIDENDFSVAILYRNT